MVNNREALAGAYNALFTIPLLFILVWTAKTAFLAGFLLCSLLTLLVVFYAVEYGHYLNRNTFYVIFESNPAESYEFFKKIFKFDPNRSIFLLVTLACGIALTGLLPKIHPAHFQFLLGTFSLVILISLLFPSLRLLFTGKPCFIADGIEYEWKSSFQNLFVLFGISLIDYLQEKKRQKKMAAMCLHEIEEIHTPQERPDEEVHILIIGESAVRTHMGLYGYFRPTTPCLQKMASELYLFQDVISSHSGTIASLRDMFTFCSYEDQTHYCNRGTLIQFIQKAGFNTCWISNQCPTGYNENFASMLTKSCDVYSFLNPSQHYVFQSYDDQVLLPLKKYLSQASKPRKFVVVHLMGQHFSFANRYPQDYARFTSTLDLKGMRGVLEQINEYDNATLFNDHVVSSIIELVKKSETHASVTYLSDHGIDLFEYSDTASQSEWDGTAPMFQIPFILWLSDTFKKNRPDLTKRLPAYLKRRFMTDDLIYSLPDLLGFSFPTHLHKRSLFRDEWVFRKRIIVDGQRKIDRRDYDQDIVVIGDELEYRRDLMVRQDEQFRKKVWAHECNSIGKLREAEQIFCGVEIDLVYDEKQDLFDVTHPPSPSIHLKIEDALSTLDNPQKLKYWFDIKNLTMENAERMSARLTEICSRFELKVEKTIVESMFVRGLTPFSRAGFRTSYYLPTPFLRKLAKKRYSRLSAQDHEQIESIKQAYRSSRVWSVSMDGYLVEFAQLFLPEVQRLLAWYEDKSPYDHFRRLEIQDLLEKEKRIEVLLLKHPSKHDRR
jgi:heptose-I-phosphate ethanolaminephosphotransferase